MPHLSWSSVSPCPSLPYLPLPQVYSSPEADIAAECPPPQAIDTMFLPCRNESYTNVKNSEK